MIRRYKIINKSYFCVHHKNRQKHNQHFKTAVFHNKFILCHIKPNIYISKIKFASHKQYLFCLLTSRNTKKTRTDQSIPRVFLLCLKRNDPQTFTSASCKNPFLQCVCYWYNLLRWMFFILCDNWKTLLFMKVCRYSEIFLSAMLLLSLKPVFWKKSVFYALSPQ